MLLAIGAYLVIQFAIGIWVSRRVTTEADYLLAGRSLGYGLATFSIFATWFGAETVIGGGGGAYADGISPASPEPFGYGLCLLLMGLVFARPLWNRKLTTLADLFRQRYGVTVERTAAVILIPSSVLWAAAQVRAFGYVLSTAGGIGAEVAIAAAAAVVILYTMFGGLLVDAITDVLQGVVLIAGLVVLLVVALARAGGDGIALALSGAMAAATPAPGGSGPGALAMLEAWAIPVCGSVVATELVARVIAARSPVVAQRSTYMGGALYIMVGLIPLALGLLARGLVPSLAEPEQAVPMLAQRILSPVLYAIFAGGLVSAILSTVDSTLLVSSGLLSHNLLVPLFGIRKERTKVLVARTGVASFGVIAYVLAVRAEGVYALVEEASAFGSAGALVTVCFALFTGIGGARTALATLLLGLGAYLAGVASGMPYPFLFSLAVSLGTYLVGGVVIPALPGAHARP